MTITKAIIRELEHTCRRYFPTDLRRYLLVKYSEEPFPYEFSEQDLYTSIWNDIRDYESGKLDVAVKRPLKRWKEERNHLQDMYIEKCCEVRDLEEYVAQLETILSEHGLESSRMAQRRAQHEEELLF
jgi:hypothetical protein